MFPPFPQEGLHVGDYIIFFFLKKHSKSLLKENRIFALATNFHYAFIYLFFMKEIHAL